MTITNHPTHPSTSFYLIPRHILLSPTQLLPFQRPQTFLAFLHTFDKNLLKNARKQAITGPKCLTAHIFILGKPQKRSKEMRFLQTYTKNNEQEPVFIILFKSPKASSYCTTIQSGWENESNMFKYEIMQYRKRRRSRDLFIENIHKHSESCRVKTVNQVNHGQKRPFNSTLSMGNTSSGRHLYFLD